jgi:hypothetical protein
MTVCRPFMVRSRSGQRTLSICNLSATGTGVPFEVANSMREGQPEINLLVNPIKEKLFMIVPDSARWERRIDKDDGDSSRHRRSTDLSNPSSPDQSVR